MPFPRGREQVERSDFSWICLLKGLGVSDEITGQQVLSKKGGPHFPQHPVLGLHGSAPLGALHARAKMGTQKGYRKTWMKCLCGAITSQGSYSSWLRNPLNFRLPEACKACLGRSPCSHAIGLHLAPGSSKNELMVWFSPDLLVPVVLLRF